ncbi:shikimate dehydrogenase [Crassaminicella profunda]|uniref:shikimate dehydrogenase n=1 Tax=Crassaminicella profunda TaxID=1286698 RepID=UPI001CA69AA5|nr:shikimate dehydrogenase [Crassaminicella profunda]QZY53639.1 shikimate dehydrogenase [Crassaminicella profunda]
MKLYGLIGEKLTHSFSPKIHEIIFKELKRKGHYHLFEIKRENLKDALYGLKALEVGGVNVTIPYKVDLMKYLDEISEEAKRIGAVNTICFRDGKTIGYNTDYYGFGMMLDTNDIQIENKRAAVLGTGGASKAVLQYLLDGGIKDITLVSRDVHKGKEKYKEFKMISYKEVKTLKDYDMLINCTPCGMYPHVDVSPVKKEDLLNFHTAIDLIYNPQETLLLKESKEKGLKAVNGLYMLVGQAIKAQELWNDVKIDNHICDKVYEEIARL